MGVLHPELVMKSIVPVVMAGALKIYALITAVIISTGINPRVKPYFLFYGYTHLSCGLAGGMAIGIFGDASGKAHVFSGLSSPLLPPHMPASKQSKPPFPSKFGAFEAANNYCD
ncbi:V-type proton ATPase 16 kDa proteolipid subunit [Aegilops tauschii subsp. strangulata]|uniref:V-type proton ATPase 16 kDa proteolipid subunit n=1 Tax=Aegilops tauschii subsp. strangulata TaxID=200361 RepID=UPI001E1C9F93|nr:V-type proton ATPase 16 kDa proteolipid subunit-like [Aegilops tauschii subsp. strangulata]